MKLCCVRPALLRSTTDHVAAPEIFYLAELQEKALIFTAFR
jgi:hypothetical protein